MRVALLFAVGSIGCATFWPTVVRTSPEEPLFHSGFPLVGGARLDGALCSLATAGSEATLLVSPPEATSGAVGLTEACRADAPSAVPGHGRIGQLVRIPGEDGDIFGYLYRVKGATGLAVAFTGLGMPPSGWINERFAEMAAERGVSLFALVRDERKPIIFDPLREARRGILAADGIARDCDVAPGALRFLGVSLGGMEALLANREALRQGRPARVAVIDPLIDPVQAADNLDSYWHSVSVDSMQAYFRRILVGRYQEKDPPPPFEEILARSRKDAATKLPDDAPKSWLCREAPAAYAIFISDSDPVLGAAQGDFAKACNFPLRRSQAPGHVPLACRLHLFDEMWAALQ